MRNDDYSDFTRSPAFICAALSTTFFNVVAFLGFQQHDFAAILALHIRFRVGTAVP